jgi:hypothetical protein
MTELLKTYYNLYFNSGDADITFDGGYIKNMHVQLHSNYEESLEYCVTNCVIPCGFHHTIRAGVNSDLKIEKNSVVHTITLPEGDYTMSVLTSTLTSMISSALGITCTVTYDETSKLLTFANDGTAQIYLLYDESSCKKVIGLTATTFIDLNSSQTLSDVPNLNTTSMIYVHSNLALQNNYSSATSSSSDILIAIPLKWLSGIAVYTSPGTYFELPYSMNSLYFKLTDQNNNILDNNGLDWSISISTILTSKKRHLYIGENINENKDKASAKDIPQ